MIMSVPSTRWFLSGEEFHSDAYARTGRRFAYTPRALRMPSSPFLRPLLGRRVVEFRQTDRAHQGGVGFDGKLCGLVGKRVAGLVNGDAAEQAFASAFGLCPNFRNVRSARALLHA